MPKPYPAAFRRQAFALLDEGRTVRDAAASLGIAGSCLHRCKRQQRIELGLASGLSDADRSALLPRSSGSGTWKRKSRSFAKLLPRLKRGCPQKVVSASSRNSQMKGCGFPKRASH